MQSFVNWLHQYPVYIENLIHLLIAALIGYTLSFVIYKGIKYTFNGVPDISDKLLNDKFRWVLQILFTVILLNLALPLINLTDNYDYFIHKVFYILLILSFALLLIKTGEFIRAVLYIKYDINVADNLDERKARTQIDFLQKLFTVIIFFIAAAIILMSFSRVRELGTSILASAGIAGIIIGLAAQKSIANLLAGFQIAFTQPLRLDDVVVVENHWGKIEEITLTYVVVKIWDNRRLILPISYFLEKPFQNWTRVSAEILGTVFLYVDFTVPISSLRQELARILTQEGKSLWDGKTGAIQVTDTTPQGIELRILVSSANSSLNWDLRCLVREQMIVFIQNNFPEVLPKIRIDQEASMHNKGV